MKRRETGSMSERDKEIIVVTVVVWSSERIAG